MTLFHRVSLPYFEVTHGDIIQVHDLSMNQLLVSVYMKSTKSTQVLFLNHLRMNGIFHCYIQIEVVFFYNVARIIYCHLSVYVRRDLMEPDIRSILYTRRYAYLK